MLLRGLAEGGLGQLERRVSIPLVRDPQMRGLSKRSLSSALALFVLVLSTIFFRLD